MLQAQVEPVAEAETDHKDSRQMDSGLRDKDAKVCALPPEVEAMFATKVII